MNKQYAVRGYLLALLIAASIASGATSFWLAAHHTINFSCKPSGPAVYPPHKAASGVVRVSAR
jgi:hypothetical protein